ncbi:MAG: glycosyltransferase family 39 protein [Alphaproteobacteria bacterium]|nr:glycosyltransferase family 39 protein [Alphaproteobacteria bacterium]
MNSSVAPGAAGFLHRALRHPRLLLTVLCLALWAPGALTLPALDRDESRFAQASKQMLETGNYIDIRFGAVPRYKKPAGIYWLQAAATELAGMGERTHIWTYRLPSLLGALVAVLLTFWCATAFLGSETALLAAGLLGTTLLLSAEASIATTDAVLLACVLGIQGMLLRVYLGARESGPPVGIGLIIAGWVAFACGILVKGPVVIGVAVLTLAGLAVWDREARWLRHTRPLVGLLVVLILVAPWLVAIGVQSHGHFFQQSLGHDFAAKLEGGQESHGAPPGYFLVLANFSFWPATLFLAPALARALAGRSKPAVRFLLIWAGTCWIMFEAVPTKLPHYILPIYPALAILAAMWVVAPRQGASRPERILTWVALLQFGLVAAVFAVAPILLTHLYGAATQWWLVAPLAVFAALAVSAIVAFIRQARLAAVACAVASALVLYPVLTVATAPRLDRLWVSERAAAAERALARPGDPPPSLAGYVEPSLVFLLGTATRQTDARGAADAGAAQGGLALVEDRERSTFVARLAELEADAAEVGSVEGFNYSRGRPVRIRIYRVTPVTDEPTPPAE